MTRPWLFSASFIDSNNSIVDDVRAWRADHGSSQASWKASAGGDG
jgi:hypothetical protein